MNQMRSLFTASELYTYVMPLAASCLIHSLLQFPYCTHRQCTVYANLLSRTITLVERTTFDATLY